MKRSMTALALMTVLLTALSACVMTYGEDGKGTYYHHQTGYEIQGSKVVWCGSVYNKECQPIDADPGSFTPLLSPEGFDGTYATDDSTVFCKGKPIPDADPASFTVLQDSGYAWIYYARDINSLYWLCKRDNLSIDADTFRQLPKPKAGMGLTSFFTDKNHVYTLRRHTSLEILNDADPATFTILDDSSAEDAAAIYRIEEKDGIYGVFRTEK